MENKPVKPPLPPPTHESYLKHRKDMMWKIVFPLVLATVLIIAASVLIGIAAFKGGDVERWAAISTIWIVIPLMVMALVILALLSGLVYGLARLLDVTPRYTGLAQHYILWFNAKLRIYADKISDPVIGIKAWGGVLSRKKE